MKWKIVQQLDNVNEQALEEAKRILQKAANALAATIDLTSNLDKLIEENLELLQRLA